MEHQLEKQHKRLAPKCRLLPLFMFFGYNIEDYKREVDILNSKK